MPNTSLREAAPTATLGDATRSKIPGGVRSVQVPHAPCHMPNTSLREAAPTATLGDATRTLSTSAQCPIPNDKLIA
ncbi:MAG: hypothetical protein V7K86_18120 [Nostoc sp.]